MKLLLLLFAGAKFGKIATTLLTMLLSIGVYATIWGWRFALGFVLLLFVHEMGHVIAAYQRGLDVSAPAFIPFMGAFITLKQHPDNVETEAYVAMGGPFLGTLASLGTYVLARQEDSDLLLAIAYSGLFLNLFNLLPISPLDGGRITAVLGPRVWFLGAPLLVAVFLYQPSPMLMVIGIVAIPQLIKAWRYDPRAPENIAYYGIPRSVKLEYTVMYLGLAAILGLMVENVHNMLAAVHGG